MTQKYQFKSWFGFLVIMMVITNTGLIDAAVSQEQVAQDLLESAGIQGGLIVHLGCGDGRLTAALHQNDRYLVHGLDMYAENVDQARDYIKSLNLYGPVSIDRLTSDRLPYTDNIVNLLVGEELGDVPMAEVMRVLAPNGKACIQEEGKWQKTTKFRPASMDEWTHFLYDSTNNAVSQDTIVDHPNHIQWIGKPRTARSHDHLASMSAAVSSGGRIFYITDEGPTEALALPPQWQLVARDAFNGVLLWKKQVGPWEGHLRGFRSGPAELARRLVAIGDRVYVTLGYGKPLTVLDAATGELIKTYKGTDDTLEIIYKGGILYLVKGKMDIAEVIKRRSTSPPPRQKHLLALEADTGNILWELSNSDTEELMPLTLAVAEGRVFFQNPDNVVCLDAKTGGVQWRTSRPIVKQRWGWSTPTLVVYGDVVFSADRKAPDLSQGDNRSEQVEWIPSSDSDGEGSAGELIAYSIKNGDELWRCMCRETFNAPTDVLVVQDLVWTGELHRSRDPGITAARDVRTGKIKMLRPKDQEFYSFGHHRCYRNKATVEFLLLGRSGVELLNVFTGNVTANHWIRGTCQYGIMPSNGLIYVPPHSCACFIEAKLNGFLAMGSDSDALNIQSDPQDEKRYEHGLAYKNEVEASSKSTEKDWPTYRHDPSRSGTIESTMPTDLKQTWKQNLGESITTPVAAEGKIFAAVRDKHTVYALDANNGEVIWNRTAGGRIDSPPTIYNGKVLFGSADGYVYCLRSSDGSLIWRFRAAPKDQRIFTFGQLESVWPVHGNVLVLEGSEEKPSVYMAAGRSSYVDGGIFLYRLDLKTGKILSQTCVNHRDPKTGLTPQYRTHGVNMPGALPDILSTDGEYIYMRHMRFNKELVEQEPNVPHLFSPAGFLDDTWWHRTYWIYGTDMNSGYAGWPTMGNQNPAGRLLVVDDSAIYGFGRLGQYATHGSHVGLPESLLPWPPASDDNRARGTTHYRLFATTKNPDVITSNKAEAKKRRGRVKKQIKCKWSKPMDLVVRAMVLADDTLFGAGPPELLTQPNGTPASQDFQAAALAAYKGKKSALLWAVSTETGEKIAEHKLDQVPILDGMIASNGRWYISTMSGEILCLVEK